MFTEVSCAKISMPHKSNVAEFATLVVNLWILKLQPLTRLCVDCDCSLGVLLTPTYKAKFHI